MLSGRLLSIAGALAASLLLYYLNPLALLPGAALVVSIAALMVVLWITEALPMPVVALLPLVLFPLLGINPLRATAISYADPVIFLFLGGFMLGLAIEKWHLHRRIALTIVRLTGTSGDRIILGFILSTGLLSMWLSNTATTMMMFPIALSVIHVMNGSGAPEKNMANFSLVLMLVIAYASNIGGIATIIGTPPNVAFVGFIREQYGYNVDFMSWMLLCMPLSLLLLLLLYLVLVKWMYPNRIQSNAAARELIGKELQLLGPINVNEKRVLVIFVATALLWMTKDLINQLEVVQLDDTMIALMGAIALFACPAKSEESKNILEWKDTQKMAWGILILFGGGIALANALEKAGLIQQLGSWLAASVGTGFMLVFAVTMVSLFVSELMSNVAQVIVFAPVVTSLAVALHINPLLLGIPMTLAASCACMMPMGTPPNAIVFSSGYIKLKQMTRAGLVINLVSVVLISVFCWYVLPLIFR